MNQPKRPVPPPAFQPNAGRAVPMQAKLQQVPPIRPAGTASHAMQMRQNPAPRTPLDRVAGTMAVPLPNRPHQPTAAVQRKPSIPTAPALLPKHATPMTRSVAPPIPMSVARKIARPLIAPPGKTQVQRRQVALPLQSSPVLPAQRKLLPQVGLIQRRVEDYKPGTLAYNTRAMKNLNPSQMKIVQQLHDDPFTDYTVPQARKLATAGTAPASNPFEWDVSNIGNYVTNDIGVQSVLSSFGHPTQSVVKLYDTLASRVGYDVGKSGKGILSSSTVNDLHQMFEATKPLHVEFNPFLNAAWTNNLDSYSGAKTGIPLYSVMRSNLTGDFKAEQFGNVTLNDILKEVSGRPSEVHHVLYKAHYPDIATATANLMLTQRSDSEARSGPGQHELMHMVAAGGDKNKFNVIVEPYVAEYGKWMRAQTGKKLV
jgi:hypothetical protein